MNRLSIPVNILRRSDRVKTCPSTESESGTHVNKGAKTKSHHGDKIQETICNKEPGKVKKIKLDASSGEKTHPIELNDPDGLMDIDEHELDLERSLLGGQSFRWLKKDANYGGRCSLLFSGIILDHVIDLWRVSPTQIAFKRHDAGEDLKLESKISTTKALLEDYFQLRYSLKDLYKDWSSRDEHLAFCCQEYTGFRILRQDPVENVFSFICATNNNIKRISQMVDKLCSKFGETLSGTQSFPSVERLAQDDVFEVLRYQLGFGYRAKYIHQTANQILKLSNEGGFKSPRDYLLSLRQLPYKETRKQLMQFTGIGRKVADCICLMSMDHLNSVPTDCHIYEIVCKHYMPNLKQTHKTVTDSVHDMIGNYFTSLHGPLAGWSSSILFIAELKHLKVAKKED